MVRQLNASYSPDKPIPAPASETAVAAQDHDQGAVPDEAPPVDNFFQDVETDLRDGDIKNDTDTPRGIQENT